MKNIIVNIAVPQFDQDQPDTKQTNCVLTIL